MSIQKISVQVGPAQVGQRLDQVLVVLLSERLKQSVSKSQARKWIVIGAVYLNGRRVRIASKTVFLNAQIDLQLNVRQWKSEQEHLYPVIGWDQHPILFEDADLLVVHKPAGLPTQPTLDQARDHLYGRIKAVLAQREQQPLEKVYLGLHHRLDRDTSGVLILTKSKRANPGLAQAFASHVIQKIYQAWVIVPSTVSLPEHWTVKNYLGRATSGRVSRNRWASVRSGGDFAHTELKVLERLSGTAIIEARPVTGRTHQIRVHLSEGGTPLLGDPTYGGPLKLNSVRIPRVMLHATSITFPHPVTGSLLMVQSPLPSDWLELKEALSSQVV